MTSPAAAAATAAEPTPPDSRRAPRTQRLLKASIAFGTVSAPVLIRNLSETGALIEAPTLPPPGEKLLIRRLHLEARASVVWAQGSRCGIRFEGRVSVPEWAAGTAAGRPTQRSQARVDSLQAAVRAGTLVGDRSAAPADAAVLGHLDHRLAEELGCVQRLMETIGDMLIDDPAVLRKYGAALQDLDVAQQVLKHVAAILAAEDRAAALDGVGMEDLRARLKRRRLFEA